MSRLLWPLAGLATASAMVTALAQNAPIQSTQLPPLQEQIRRGEAPPETLPLIPPSVGTGPSALPGTNPGGTAYPGAAPAPGVPAVGNVPSGTAPPDAGPIDQGDAQPPAPAGPAVAVERPNVWLPGKVVKLQALDKVNAQAGELTIKVGQSATFESLTITVRSCMIRPPDQPADAAAYLDVTDSHPDSPGFDGWLLRNEPSVSMMEHPIYDLRVTGCA